MKKTLTLIAAFALLSFTAFAQMDFYAVPRVLAIPSVTISNTLAQQTATTMMIDTRDFTGPATLLIAGNVLIHGDGVTNVAGGAPVFSVTLYQSSTPSNNLAGITTGLAYSTATEITTTNNNLYTGTNAVATNTFMLPGVLTTPTAATAGFASQYLTPAAFTNAGTIATNKATTAYYAIGLQPRDLNRYLALTWTSRGTNSQLSGNAFLIGRKAGGGW